MRFNHVHVPVRDLRAALEWLRKVWKIRPAFEDGGMAVVDVHGISLVLDAAEEDGVVTVGFSSDDCDEDFRVAVERGAEALEPPEDRAWGVRAAYLRGPGRITFEIEQALPIETAALS
jgi:catechol 2,3-dioxygenase-like lactoylglutathione lyase family enzyme